MGGLAVWARLAAVPVPELSGERVSRSYDLTGFDGVETNGQWQVTIERGDAWSVALEAPVELVANLEVEIEGGDELSLGYASGWCAACFRDENVIEATITMPVLESLEISGASKLSFSGFEGSALSVDVSGAVDLRGADSRFETLTLDLSGAGAVDLSEVPTTNAEVDVSGAGNVKLRMAGGRLTGDMSGAANLEYSGTVSEESVEESGFVNIRRRN
jgi:hypothetical protein